MVAFNVDTMAGPCHGRIRSWPRSDPRLMGLGMKDLGPRRPGGDLRPREPEAEGPKGVMRFEKNSYIY